MLKKKIAFVIIMVAIFSLVAACSNDKEEESNDGNKPDSSVSDSVEKVNVLNYSNLVDEESQNIVKDALKKAGVDSAKIDSFIKDVNTFNTTVGDVGLVQNGFNTIDSLKADYDEVKMIEVLEQNYPEVLWHNCRITIFRLLDDFIEVKNPKIDDIVMLFQDQETIDKDKSLVGERKDDFLSLFSYIKTKNTEDVQEHIKVLKDSWKEKGISFNNEMISVITVVFNLNIEEQDDTSQLFIGHAGLLWEGDEGKLYFLEKLSFMEPYQLVKFNNRQELSDYLMNKYDVDINQKIAIPFVMENGELIEGYRPNLDKKLDN